jgi:RNA polymerase sigma factor (sigma-70 family)
MPTLCPCLVLSNDDVFRAASFGSEFENSNFEFSFSGAKGVKLWASNTESAGERPMNDQPAWRDLKERFISATDSANNQRDWLDVWRLFVEHPWYQEQLQLCAQRVLRRSFGPLEWLEDLKQDAMMLLARKLRGTPDMNANRELLEEHFPGWLGTIIRRDCQETLRQMRRRQPIGSEAVHEDRIAGRCEDLEARIDFSLLLDQLPDPERTIVMLYGKGWELQEMANELGLSYWKTRRLLHQGVEQIAGKLGERRA